MLLDLQVYLVTKICVGGAGEMAQWLIVVTAISGYLGFIVNIHGMTYL